MTDDQRCPCCGGCTDLYPDGGAEPCECPPERYFVCEHCAHQWNAPEYPDECENCRCRGWQYITELADADEQDDHSAAIVERRGGTRS